MKISILIAFLSLANVALSAPYGIVRVQPVISKPIMTPVVNVISTPHQIQTHALKESNGYSSGGYTQAAEVVDDASFAEQPQTYGESAPVPVPAPAAPSNYGSSDNGYGQEVVSRPLAPVAPVLKAESAYGSQEVVSRPVAPVIRTESGYGQEIVSRPVAPVLKAESSYGSQEVVSRPVAPVIRAESGYGSQDQGYGSHEEPVSRPVVQIAPVLKAESSYGSQEVVSRPVAPVIRAESGYGSQEQGYGSQEEPVSRPLASVAPVLKAESSYGSQEVVSRPAIQLLKSNQY